VNRKKTYQNFSSHYLRNLTGFCRWCDKKFCCTFSVHSSRCHSLTKRECRHTIQVM